MSRPAVPWSAVDARVAAEPTRPLLTCYLDPPETGPQAGESDRIDLTGTTWTTWVAKTVNMLAEIGGLTAGEPAAVLLRLPAHWQTAVWTEACLRLGAQVELRPDGEERSGRWAVVAADPSRLDHALADDADEVFVLPLLPMNGASRTPLPAGVWDYAAEVSAFGDRAALGPGAAATARLAGMDGAEMVSEADARATAAGLTAGGRLLAGGAGTGGPWLDLLAAARLGGSLVLAPDQAALDPERATRRWAAERVTAIGGPGPRH